jgi:hypothetical protein
MGISPGLQFIGRSLVQFLAPCLITFGTLVFITNGVAFPLPGWLVVVLSIFPHFIFLRMKSSIDNHRNFSAGRALGAAMPPHIDVRPIDASKRAVENFKTGYPGSSMIIFTRAIEANYNLKLTFSRNGLSSLVKRSGSLLAWRNECVVSTFTPVNLLRSFQFFTTEPDHVKVITFFAFRPMPER